MALQPEEGYHLHFLNDNRTQALAQRVAAFFHHYWTKSKYTGSRSVFPPEPRNVEEELFVERDFGEALARAIRDSAGP